MPFDRSLRSVLQDRLALLRSFFLLSEEELRRDRSVIDRSIQHGKTYRERETERELGPSIQGGVLFLNTTGTGV